jgi:hypothetical protein
MLVLCYGIPKSGSTLAYEMVRGILLSAGYPQERLEVPQANLKPNKRGKNYMRAVNGKHGPKDAGADEHRSMTTESITGLVDAVGPHRMIAVKTHEPLPRDMFAFVENLQQQKKLQIIASYRDPRDICVSLLDAARKARKRGRTTFSANTDLQSAAKNVERRIRAFRRWASVQGSLRLYYESVAFASDTAISSIEQVLGLSVDHEKVKKYAFEDAHTLMNKGISNRYLESFTPEEQQDLYLRFRTFIEDVCKGGDDAWFDDFRQSVYEKAEAKQKGSRRAAPRA